MCWGQPQFLTHKTTREIKSNFYTKNSLTLTKLLLRLSSTHTMPQYTHTHTLTTQSHLQDTHMLLAFSSNESGYSHPGSKTLLYMQPKSVVSTRGRLWVGDVTGINMCNFRMYCNDYSKCDYVSFLGSFNAGWGNPYPWLHTFCKNMQRCPWTSFM